MKYLLTIFLLFVLTLNGTAKSKSIQLQIKGKSGKNNNLISSDVYGKTDIHRLVKNQINEARKNAVVSKKELSSLQYEINQILMHQNKSGASDMLLTKLLILSVASLLAVVVIYYRRLKLNGGKQFKNVLKRNIALMREEKPLHLAENRNKSVRNQLLNDPKIFNTGFNDVSGKAKDLQISKGELLLATKIKSYQMKRAFREK